MSATIITIVLAILGGSTGAALVTAYANREKNRAQVHNMNIEGDLKIGENWKDYATVLRRDLDGMKTELTLLHNKYLDLEMKYNTLSAEHLKLVAEHAILLEERKADKARIIELESKVATSETRIVELQNELNTYKEANA